ncbi:MAG: hypothetical protein JO299_20025 [Gammaproteobacteria bacterium]|nr:hypothetical protein [Gammaproteobacteria bacterium]
MTSFFDQTAYERERARLPRFIVRAPQGEQDWYAFEHSWELVYEWSVKKYLDKGWECRSIQANDPIVCAPTIEEGEQREKAQRRQIEAWADEFLNSGIIRAVTPSDREAVLRIAEVRLREIVNDGFLIRALRVS